MNSANTLWPRFLLPALQIRSVLEQTSISKRWAALNKMPKKLDDTFQSRIEWINQQTPARSSQGMEILKWTFLAERKLSIPELRQAIAVTDISTDTLDQNDLPFERSFIDCCCGLLFSINKLRLFVSFTNIYRTTSSSSMKSLNCSKLDIATLLVLALDI